jgi:DNA-binding transcriptional LysR family regulator
MQDLNDMLLFAKIVEAGGYSAAARALGLPTSKLSRHISDLEESLGVRLLNRTTRKISTTEVGRMFYLHCVAVVAQAQAAREAIEKTRSAPCGVLRVSCPPGLLHNQVHRTVTRFLADHPLVRLQLDATNRRVDIVEEGIDVAIRVRTAPPESSELVVRPLGKTELVLLGSPSLLEQHGRPVVVADLASYPTLGMSGVGEKHVWQLVKGEGSAEAHVHIPRLATDDFTTLYEAAVAGLGITYLPEYMARAAVAAGTLEHVLPELSLPQGTVQAVFSSRRGMVPAVRSFLDALVEDFA